MATTTQAVLRQTLSPRLQEYHGGTATSAGSTTTLVDTGLKDFPDGYWDNGYVRITSGTYSGQTRRIKGFAQSTGIITYYNALDGNTGTSTYELHKQFNPDRLDTAIQDAVRQVHPHLFQPLEINDICIGSYLANGSFEDWTKRMRTNTIAFVDSNPDTITDTGSGFVTAGFEAGDVITISGGVNDGSIFTIATVAAGTLILSSDDGVVAAAAGAVIISISTDWIVGDLSKAVLAESTVSPFHGESCARLIATGAVKVFQRQNPTYAPRAFLLLDDSSVTFYAWVWVDAASTIRLYITDPDGTTYGDYHSETGGWERLSVTRTVNTTGNVDFGFDVASANFMFLDAAFTTGGPALYDYAIPTTLPGQPLVVEYQRSTALPEGSYIRVDPSGYEVIERTGGGRYLRFTHDRKPPDGRWLRVRGLAYLSDLSSDTDTVEVGAPQTDIIIAQAAVNLLTSRPFGEGTMSEESYEQALARWSYNLDKAIRDHGMQLPKHSKSERVW